ncbi:MAG: hypothetical protein IJ379_14105 [Lachnospiraceae bacterium]|nr:hypothetical protein [Lachnospiraceae bacterium]
MLHIEYRKTPYEGSTFEFKPDSETQIPGLREMLNHNFQLENPAKTFAMKMKAGGYDDWPEEVVAAEAQRANILADAWNMSGTESGGKAVENIMMVMCRLMQLYVEERLK